METNELEKLTNAHTALLDRKDYLNSIIAKDLLKKFLILSFSAVDITLSLIFKIFAVDINVILFMNFLFLINGIGIYEFITNDCKTKIKEYEKKEPNYICSDVKEAQKLVKELEKSEAKIMSEIATIKKQQKNNIIKRVDEIVDEANDKHTVAELEELSKYFQNIENMQILEELENIQKKVQYTEKVETQFTNFVNEPICERTILNDIYRINYQSCDEPVTLSLKKK